MQGRGQNEAEPPQMAPGLSSSDPSLKSDLTRQTKILKLQAKVLIVPVIASVLMVLHSCLRIDFITFQLPPTSDAQANLAQASGHSSEVGA